MNSIEDNKPTILKQDYLRQASDNQLKFQLVWKPDGEFSDVYFRKRDEDWNDWVNIEKLVEENKRLKEENEIMYKSLEEIRDFNEEEHDDGYDQKEAAEDALSIVDLNRDPEFIKITEELSKL